MDILINTIPLLSPLTGVGKYTFYITTKLKEIDFQNNYTYYYGYYSREIKKIENNISLMKLNKFKNLIRGTAFYSLLKLIKDYSAILSTKSFDLYFEPNFVILNKIKAKKYIVVVHDFSFDKYPFWHPEERVKYFKTNFWINIKRADIVVFPSHFILNEAVNDYGFDREKLRVVYLGVDNEIFKHYPAPFINIVLKKYNLPEKYILFVGSIEPRKNLKNLILAYCSLPDYLKKNFKLVVVGLSGWNNDEIFSILKENRKNIIYTGYIPEKDLAILYSMAELLVYPSFYEGFGLPPLEAMACGCPVIVSDRASLPEVCGDAAFYCEPNDPDSIAEAIQKILEDRDLRDALIKRAKNRIKFFKWEDTAKNLLKFFNEIMN